MIKLNLIDKYFIGDAENSFVEYTCEEYDKVNSNEYKKFYIPDYTDYNFQSYFEPSIPLVDSRGCVQKCEFCDVIELWPKFTYKTAQDIFDEMLLQIKKYNIFHFDFRSSISNGNQKEFLKLLHLMSDYNQEKFRCEQISWEGSFIVRSTRNQQMWELIKKSNGSLFLGVESVVESVRNGLGKKFTNQDLDWHLDQIKHHKIDALLLLIAHYPTETKKDYEFTKQWFVDRKHFSKYIKTVRFTQLAILNDTRLHRNIKEHQIEIIHINQADSWISKKTNITIKERNQYFNELVGLVKSLGFVVS
jgi:radical SAM superfamily enzyme YgiQ (UPF0313 family)